MMFWPISRAAKIAQRFLLVLLMVAAALCLAITACRADNETQDRSRQNIDWTTYMRTVQATVTKKWHPELDKWCRKDAETLLKFQIKKDGHPQHVSVVRTSGIQALDQQAELALLQCKFEPLPAGASETVDVEFSFEYKVHDRNRLAQAGSEDSSSSTSDESKPLWGEKDGFRVFHYLMRVSAPVLMFCLLFVQFLMLLIFFVWLGIESLKLFLSKRWLARQTSGEQAHNHKN